MAMRSAILSPTDVIRTLSIYRRRWIVPTVALTALALVYAIFRTNTWEASQALFVRNEAHSVADRPGKFAQSEDMKTTQETIVELARSDTVLEAALTLVGPANGKTASAAWPTSEDIEDLRGNVKITPPNGAELGKTEVFYVRVTARDRDRALALTTAIIDNLQARFQKLQGDKAQSMIQELERTAALAENDLSVATNKLAGFERGVGSDLAELRILTETPSGTSDLRQKVVQVENELREAETTHRAAAQLVTLLRQCEGDPTRLVALPDRLLKSHATLSRLIEGLGQARLRTSNLLGSKSGEHPLVLAAKAEEEEVLGNLREELTSAIRIAVTEESLNEERFVTLNKKLADTQARLERLAGLRADYGNRVSEVKSREKLSDEARGHLSEARASRAAATSATLINRIDDATTGARPIGPRRSLIVLGGMAGGLLIGLAIVFLTAPMNSTIQVLPPVPAEWRQSPNTVESIAKSTGGLTLKQALSKIQRIDSRWN